MKKETWYIYILECKDSSFYTGITNNLEKRMTSHKSGKGSKYVKAKGFNHLVASKTCKNKSEALKAEYKVKQLPKNEKLDFFFI